jgi:hypothetical protein
MSFLKNPFAKNTPTRFEQVATNVGQGVAVAVIATMFIRGVEALFSASVPTSEAVGTPTCKELRAACKQAGIHGYSKMNKQQLVDALVAPAGA